jgi:4-carboxymuconolactone decarboxylase
MASEPTSERTHRPGIISEAAHKNHEELFPNHKSTLKVTDPELIEVFDNFAFNEVLAHTQLDTKTRVAKFQQRYQNSHRIFRNLLCSKNFR